MTKIKICGITQSIEVEYLNRYLPDYAGFVFTESKRRVTAEKAAALSACLVQGIKKVGVFVDMEPASAAAVAAQVGLDVLQLHGSEDEEYIGTLRLLLEPGTEIWKAVRVASGNTIDSLGASVAMPDSGLIPPAKADRILLDSYLPGIPGGTGKTFDWTLASRFGSALPIILAGGLNPDNVKQAIEQVRPFAVDTSSGIEDEGIKDEYKLKAFIETVRRK
jgi:phosphoribosylanthranilate isomerase